MILNSWNLPYKTRLAELFDEGDTIVALLRPITETLLSIVTFSFSTCLPEMTTFLNHLFVPRQKWRNLHGFDAGPHDLSEMPSLSSMWHSSPGIYVFVFVYKKLIKLQTRKKKLRGLSSKIQETFCIRNKVLANYLRI